MAEELTKYPEIKEDIDRLLKKVLKDVKEDDLKIKLMSSLVNVRELVSDRRRSG